VLRIVCLSTGKTRRIKSRLGLKERFLLILSPSQLGIYSYAYSRSSPSRRRVGWWRVQYDKARPNDAILLVVS